MPDETVMADKDCRNGAWPPAEDRQLQQPCEASAGATGTVDPRILTIARAIGRLIARERFEELTETSRPEDR